MLLILHVAGLKFFPPTAKWVSHSGFSTSKDSLVFLEGIARSKGMTEAETFLQSVRRLSAVETYLSSFIDGIATHTKQDGKLHVRLLQHRTGTGRLSGADPNMQNMPRGGTFPVKTCVQSRWEGGQIMEADFAQLRVSCCCIPCHKIRLHLMKCLQALMYIVIQLKLSRCRSTYLTSGCQGTYVCTFVWC